MTSFNCSLFVTHEVDDMNRFYRCEVKEVESVFDIMDLEDDERNELLQLPDSKMQVRKCDCLFVCG